MANKYAITGGGNWSGATWNTASNQATSNTSAPTTSDVALLDAYSGIVTVDTTTCVCSVIDMRNYAQTLTLTSTKKLTISGGGTSYLAGTLAGTGTIDITTTDITINYVNATSSSGVLLTSAKAVTHVGPGTSAFTWGNISHSAGNLILNTDVYTVNLGSAASIWATTGSANWKISVSGSTTGTTYAGNSGSPVIVMSGTGSIAVCTIGCNFTIDTTGSIAWTAGAYNIFNPSNKIFTYVKGTQTGLSAVVMSFTGNGELNTNGMTWGTIKLYSYTLTMSSNLQCDTFDGYINSSAVVQNKAGFSNGTITANTFMIENKASVTLPAGNTLACNYFYINGVQGISTSLVSGTSSSDTYVNFTGTENSSDIFLATLTDVNFNSTRKMYNWFGTQTRVTNCTVVDTNKPSLTN